MPRRLPSGRGDGVPASSLVEVQDGAKILYCLAGKPDTTVLVASSGGYAFHTKLADMVSNRRAGREFMTLDEIGGAGAAGGVHGNARQLRSLRVRRRQAAARPARRTEVPAAADAASILMGLDKGEKLVAVMVSDQPTLTVIGIGRGGKEKEVVLGKKDIGHFASSRAHKGRVLPEKVKPTGFKAVPKLELNG